METSDLNQLRDTMDMEMDLPPVVRSKYAEIGDETDSGGQDLESLKGAGGPSVHSNDLVIGRGEVKVAQDFIGSSDDKKQGIRMEMNAWREQPDDDFVKNGKFDPILLDLDDGAYNPALGCVEVEVGTESANVNIDAIARANGSERKAKAGTSSSGINWKPQLKGYEQAMHHLTPEQRETVRKFQINLADAPVSHQPRGVCGIPNLGNTCYLNSVIQCLNQCWPLLTYFLRKKYMIDVNTENALGTKGKVAHAFGKLLLAMWNRVELNKTINGLRLAVSESHVGFEHFQQQDAQELYTLLLDMLHEDVNQGTRRVSVEEVQTLNRSDEEIANETWNNHLKRNRSIIVDNFHGLIRSTLLCLLCGHESVKFEPLVHMPLPLPWKQQFVVKFTLHFYSHKRAIQRNKVTLDADGTVGDLAETVGKYYRLDVNQLLIAHVVGSHFHRLFELSDQLSCIGDEDDIAIYEIPMAAVNNPTRYFITPVVLMEEDRRGSNSGQLFGQPFVVVISIEKYTYLNLCSHISDYLKLQITNDTCDLNKNKIADVNGEECALVDQYGFTLGSMIDSNSDGMTRNKNAHGDSLLVARCTPGTRGNAGRGRLTGPELKCPNSGIDITDCIREALKEEIMEYDDAWQCSNCAAKREAKKKMDFWFLPKVIVMQLKRFRDSNSSSTGMVTRRSNVHWEKNDALVDAPLEIDMGPFIVGPKPEFSTYKLFGVVNHSGVLQGGHYQANVYCKAVGKWFRCNDWQIVPITDLSQIITQQAYVLFYMRSDEFDKPLDM